MKINFYQIFLLILILLLLYFPKRINCQECENIFYNFPKEIELANLYNVSELKIYIKEWGKMITKYGTSPDPHIVVGFLFEFLQIHEDAAFEFSVSRKLLPDNLTILEALYRNLLHICKFDVTQSVFLTFSNLLHLKVFEEEEKLYSNLNNSNQNQNNSNQNQNQNNLNQNNLNPNNLNQNNLNQNNQNNLNQNNLNQNNLNLNNSNQNNLNQNNLNQNNLNQNNLNQNNLNPNNLNKNNLNPNNLNQNNLNQNNLNPNNLNQNNLNQNNLNQNNSNQNNLIVLPSWITRYNLSLDLIYKILNLHSLKILNSIQNFSKSYHSKDFLHFNPKSRIKIGLIFDPSLESSIFNPDLFISNLNSSFFEFIIINFSPNQIYQSKKQKSQEIQFSSFSCSSFFQVLRNYSFSILIDLVSWKAEIQKSIAIQQFLAIASILNITTIDYSGYSFGIYQTKYIDYYLTDSFITPKKYFPIYSQKIHFLSNFYVSNIFQFQKIQGIELGNFDDFLFKKIKSQTNFCFFGDSWKIDSRVFLSWIHILQKTESILFIEIPANIGEDEIGTVKTELREKIKLYPEIQKNRIQFIRKFSEIKDELNFFRENCDIFLDSFVFGNPKIVQEIFWLGIPIITFPSKNPWTREVFSIIKSQYPEFIKYLVADSIEDYEEKAVKLSKNKKLIKLIQNEIKENQIKIDLENREIWIKEIEEFLKGIEQKKKKKKTEN
ncbi:udp-n-acetylglucosamine--peptide n-acetylglucosaminyltransferase [Anaeramoeba ignava]|uniref:Udp-n-acetylglucosamine--peptide n-acetylglucosaminyltransferase n=1 Tax=Anaeramoeba ignava TaxID=1746090 RepID=A0A9Q0LH52_ANAIG|nr:udp-n-acetylglucosamine--peptide n-acetylglucosaminyltransferase [Anaeramoeba ignava]